MLECQAAYIEIYKNVPQYLFFKIWSAYSNLFTSFGHKHDTSDRQQRTPYARFNDKQYALWAWTCDSLHCSLSGMHWDSQQYTVIQMQWADMTLITSFSDGEDGDSLWNTGYQLHTDKSWWPEKTSLNSITMEVSNPRATCHVCYNLILVRYGSLDKATNLRYGSENTVNSCCKCKWRKQPTYVLPPQPSDHSHWNTARRFGVCVKCRC